MVLPRLFAFFAEKLEVLAAASFVALPQIGYDEKRLAQGGW